MKRIKNGLNKLIKDSKKKIKIIKTEHLIRQFIQNNFLLIVFVLTNVINSTVLRFFCMKSVENYLSVKAILADTVVAMFIIQTIDGNVVNPRLLGTKIHIHPLLVIISLLIGGAIGGIAGMILAVPCGALIKRYFERFVDFRIKKSYGEKE